MVTLTLSGYLLYYVGSDSVRDIMALVHWAIGLALPLLTVWHVWRGRVWRQIKLAEQRAPGVVVGVPDDEMANSQIRHRAGGARS